MRLSRDCAGCQTSEIWKEHPQFAGLWVSNLGRVHSTAREITQGNRWGGINTARLPAKDCRPTKTSAGYLIITFNRRQHRIHVLMLECFVGPKPGSKWHACHRDDVGSHNCLKNLRWDTPRGNRADVVARNGQGRMYGAANPLTKISARMVKRIKRLVATQRTGRSIANEMGISEAQVSRIKHGLSRSWS